MSHCLAAVDLDISALGFLAKMVASNLGVFRGMLHGCREPPHCAAILVSSRQQLIFSYGEVRLGFYSLLICLSAFNAQ